MITKGIIAIDKPKDWTSFDVVNKIKHLVRPSKVGHLGTLDPMATGVLLVTIGKMTKLFDIMQNKTKTYRATFEFGYTTDTLDATGKLIDKTDTIPNIDEIRTAISSQIGDIEQVPPNFSAKSIGGVRAYDLARRGVEFELKPKRVTIYDIKIISYNAPILQLEITCGSGTYIRSIGRDIARLCGSLACMIELTRTSVGSVDINCCLPITRDAREEDLLEYTINLEQLLGFSTINLDETNSKLLNGMSIHTDKPDGDYILTKGNDYLAIVNVKKNIAKMTICLE